MASVDTGAIEGEIDRIRSLGLEELRREWRRLNHGEPPRISRVVPKRKFSRAHKAA
jgi:hypothetical protein